MEWQALSSSLLIASQSTLGSMESRHQDWFDDNATDIRSLIHDKNTAHDALLRNPNSRTLRERFSSKRATAQRKLRWMENNWWAGKAAQIQSYANINDTKSFYEALKGVYGPRRFSWHPILTTDGVLIMNKELIISKLDDPPSFDEVERAIQGLKDNKAAGPDNIHDEVIKYGGCALHRRLHSFIHDRWSAMCLPQQWKNAMIILVYRQNGNRTKRGNSRGISRRSVAGKVLEKIMLTRHLEHVDDLVLPESQCGFRRGLSTIDMIFVSRQLQEKCREQHQYIYMAFVDLTKAFDTVNRDILWNILRKFGCPPTFIAILQQFHTGMCAQVVMAGSQSSSFPVEVGVKKDCVLAPIIFYLLLVSITLVSHRDLQSSDFVGIEYRLDGGFFNLRRIQAQTKTSSAMIFALQYADDAAFPCLTADGLQRCLDVMSETYLRAGLIINTTKTEILSTSSPDAPTFSISGNHLKNSEYFTFLGSNVSFSGDLSNEIQRRINLASSAFGRLSKRVFGNQYLTNHTKIVVHDAVVVVVVVDPTPPTCCQQSPAHESCGSQQSPPQVARKGSTLSGFVQRSRLEREVGRDLHSNKWEEV